MSTPDLNTAVVYRHIRPDKNEVFYIGVGLNHERAYTKKGRNKHWNAIVALCGGDYRVDILCSGLTPEQAREKEVWFISLYGRSDLGSGTLCNLTDGGDGVCRRVFSPETIERIRLKKLGANNPMFGKTISEETRKKRSEALSKENNPQYGKKFSDEYRQKLSKAHLGMKYGQETIEKRRAKIKGQKRSQEFCALMKEMGLKQSEIRRQNALKQWAARKAAGHKNLKK